MRIGSLFSGAGGLDLAVQEVFGGDVVWHAEIDKAASKVLAYRFPGVPNLGDISAVDWAEVPAVDVLCGGFPCTDVSAAGKRAGMHGTRSGLWSHMAEAIDVLRPRHVVIENVRGLLSANANRPMERAADDLGNGADRPVLRAIGAVLGDLADIGSYEARWVTVAAADVGAPHRRERVFILATDTRSGGWDSGVTRAPFPCGSSGGLANGGFPLEPACTQGGHASDAPRNGWDEGRPEPARLVGGFDAAVSRDGHVELLPTPGTMDDREKRTTHARGNLTLQGAVVGVNPVDVERHSRAGRSVGDGDVALLPTPRSSDCFGAGQHGNGGMDLRTTVVENASQWGKYAPAIARWEQITGPAPAPTEPNKNGNPRLSAAFSEWLMGWPQGWVTHPDIGISRNDQLRIIGNGVCPQQATLALRFLLAVSEVTA